MTIQAPPSRATWREWLGLAVLTLPIFMMANDVSVLFLALPAIGADLQPHATQSLWILHIGELLGVGLVLTMGRLGDRIGRRRLLFTGLAAYAVASTLAAFAPNPETLILARALLGASVATLSPSTLSLLRHMFPDPRQFSLAVALNLSAFSVGMALGPPMGGLLLEFFWWGSLFLVNVPVALLALATLPFLLPEFRDRNAGRLDVMSVLLSTVALIVLVYGLQELAEQGPRPLLLAAVVTGLVLGWVFLRRQRRLADPLLQLDMFATRAFLVSVSAMTLMIFVTAGPDLFLVQFLQSVLGISPGLVGALLIVPAVGGLVGGLLPPVLIRVLTVGQVMGASKIVALAGLVTVVLAAGQGSVQGLIAGSTLVSLGAPVMTLGSQVALSSVPEERTGSASAVTDVATGMGQTLSLALLGSVGLAVYRSGLETAKPDGAFGDTADAAGDSIGAAVSIADELGGATGEALQQAAGASFGDALQVTAGTAAVLTAVSAVAVTVLLWRHRAD